MQRAFQTGICALLACTLLGCGNYKSKCWKEQYKSETVLSYTGVWAPADDQAFVVGDSGILLRFTGENGWQEDELRLSGGGVFGNSPDNVYIASTDKIRKLEGDTWNVVYEASEHYEGSVAFKDIWVAPNGEVFAVADPGPIVHFDGVEWGLMENGRSYSITSVWGFSEAEVYAAAFQQLLRYDGSNWQAIHSSEKPTIDAVWGTSPDNLYTAGIFGILHFDGESWTHVYESGSYTGIWGFSDDLLIAVGDADVLVRDQDEWKYSNEKDLSLRDVWGSSTEAIYAVGCKWKHPECTGVVVKYTCNR